MFWKWWCVTAARVLLVCDYITCQRICIWLFWSAVILIHFKGPQGPHCPTINAVTQSTTISSACDTADACQTLVKFTVGQLPKCFFSMIQSWNIRHRNTYTSRTAAIVMIAALGTWWMEWNLNWTQISVKMKLWIS